MLSRQVTLSNRLGLHVRAASKLVRTASAYASEIFLEVGERRANGKSIMSVMLLAAGCGATLTLEVNGEDEDQALQALEELIADKFGEGE
jgi:phosphocarrier protein HPr